MSTNFLRVLIRESTKRLLSNETCLLYLCNCNLFYAFASPSYIWSTIDLFFLFCVHVALKFLAIKKQKKKHVGMVSHLWPFYVPSSWGCSLEDQNLSCLCRVVIGYYINRRNIDISRSIP